MGAFARYLKESPGCRFSSGGVREAEGLLGCPLPFLPPPAREGPDEVFFVNFHPRFRIVLQRYLEGLLGQIGIEVPAPRNKKEADQAAGEFEGAFSRILRSVRMADRGLGLA